MPLGSFDCPCDLTFAISKLKCKNKKNLKNDQKKNEQNQLDWKGLSKVVSCELRPKALLQKELGDKREGNCKDLRVKGKQGGWVEKKEK